jgi:hypothetical protein
MVEIEKLEEETAGEDGDSFPDFKETESGKTWNLKEDETKEELEDRVAKDNNPSVNEFVQKRYPQGV